MDRVNVYKGKANMAYTPEQIEEKFDIIIEDISENGLSLRRALDGMSSRTFFEWLDEDKEKQKRYARACEARADRIFEEIIEIADKQDKDVIGEDENGNEIINHNIIARNRLQVDARKWAVSKMNPKKYGDKIDHTTGGEKLPSNAPTLVITTPDGTKLDDFTIE